MAYLPNWSDLADFGNALFDDYLTFERAVTQLKKLPMPPVSVFGGSRLSEKSIWYEQAEQLGALLAQKKIPVMTGGGPGVMHAVSCGVRDSGDAEMINYSFGITVRELNDSTPCLGNIVEMNYFFTRKLLLIYYSWGFIIFPGGFGTLDELAETLTLLQTKQRAAAPVILIGREFWQPFLAWLCKHVHGLGLISAKETELFMITDSVEEAIAHLMQTFNNQLTRN